MNTYLTTEMMTTLVYALTPFKHETGLRGEVVAGHYLIFNKENRLVYWKYRKNSGSSVYIKLPSAPAVEFRERHPVGIKLQAGGTYPAVISSVRNRFSVATAYPLASEVPIGEVFCYDEDEDRDVIRNCFSDNVARAKLKKATYKGQHLWVAEVTLRVPAKFVKSRRGLVYRDSKDVTLRGCTRSSSRDTLLAVIANAFDTVAIDAGSSFSFTSRARRLKETYTAQHGYNEKLKEALRYELEQEEQESQREAEAAEAQAAEATEG